jgi:hypothetical protein
MPGFTHQMEGKLIPSYLFVHNNNIKKQILAIVFMVAFGLAFVGFVAMFILLMRRK